MKPNPFEADLPPPAPKGGQDPFGDEVVEGDCYITIGSQPWAQLWIDGRNTFRLTPVVDLKVPCGRRTISLRNPDHRVERSETVTLRAGETYKRVLRLTTRHR
jgi:hypothetical protein